MTFEQSIRTCFTKYAEFTGRATRSEFWWFFLFTCLVSAGCDMLSHTLSALFSLATLLPSLAVAARRLHDTNRSAWWLLLLLVPIIGWIVLLVFYCQETAGAAPGAPGATA
ncbi:MAG TPA: DUF805 domain-containing protein [Burkholderiaceae bacterium]